jgi:hypothetical protein
MDDRLRKEASRNFTPTKGGDEEKGSLVSTTVRSILIVFQATQKQDQYIATQLKKKICELSCHSFYPSASLVMVRLPLQHHHSNWKHLGRARFFFHQHRMVSSAP